jgi:hypothetical protein
LLPLSQDQKEWLKEWPLLENLRLNPAVVQACSGEFDLLGTQESASRFDLGSGETDE